MRPFIALHRWGSIGLLAGAAIVTIGCSDGPSSPGADGGDPAFAAAPAPGGLATIDGTAIRLWPFLSTDLETAHDPLALLVAGEGDPRRIRAALLGLNGNRAALPPPFNSLAMFDCTWTDGIGDEQATYVGGIGWTASAIQLECGAFGPAPRFHARLFDAGDAVLIGAHFEIQVPATTDHEVLNFDIARALVAADLLRAGLIGVPSPTTAPIAAIAREIRTPVYDALVNDPEIGPLMPLLTGGPDRNTWNAADPKPVVIVPNDGHPFVAPTLQRFESFGGPTSQSFVVELDQVIPKPFCAVDEQLVHVKGPVHFSKLVTIGPDGRQTSEIRAYGEVVVTPLRAPGEAYRAAVGEVHRSWLTAEAHSVHWLNHQILLPAKSSERGNHRLTFHVASSGPAQYRIVDRCGGEAGEP
jgi:hypothetical protein